MAFVVEDGTGLANSNSYEEVAEFDAYCQERGLEIMSQYDDTQKQRALVKGTEYLDLGPGRKFLGRRLEVDQALKFPRACLPDPEFCGVYITGIPNKLKYALSECAYRELLEPGILMADPVVDETGLQVQASFEKVGPIEERKTYLGSAPKAVKSFPKVDAYLVDYVAAGGARSYRA